VVDVDPLTVAVQEENEHVPVAVMTTDFVHVTDGLLEDDAVTVAVYVPGEVYVCETLAPAPVPPSPNTHE